MNEQEVKIRIKELTDLINQYNYNYYTLSQPTVSDFNFDMMLKELESLERQNPALADPNSPTQKVGGQITNGTRQLTNTNFALDSDVTQRDTKSFKTNQFSFATSLLIDFK